jgi:hypothetical protein
MMNGEPHQRGAAILFIVTSVVWLHQWLPVLVPAAFVLWVLLHQRLEGDLGEGLLRRWRRVWPPRALVLVPLLLAGTLVYWVADVPIRTKVMPIALNLLALSMLLFGNWWRFFPHLEASWRARRALSRKGPEGGLEVRGSDG